MNISVSSRVHPPQRSTDGETKLGRKRGLTRSAGWSGPWNLQTPPVAAPEDRVWMESTFRCSPEPAWCWARSRFSEVLVDLSRQWGYLSWRHHPLMMPALKLHPTGPLSSHLAFLMVFSWNLTKGFGSAQNSAPWLRLFWLHYSAEALGPRTLHMCLP